MLQQRNQFLPYQAMAWTVTVFLSSGANIRRPRRWRRALTRC